MRKINVYFVSFNHLTTKGAVNTIVDSLYDEIDKTGHFRPYILAERAKNSKVDNKDRRIKTFYAGGGRFHESVIMISLFLRLLFVRNRPDIIHLHQMVYFYYLPLHFYSRIFHIPIVVTNHNFFFDRFTRIRDTRFFKSRELDEIYSNTYFVCISREIKTEMMKLGISEARLVHNPYGIISPAPARTVRAAGKKVIWIGRYGVSKNFSLLLRTIEKTINQDSKVRFIICGVSSNEITEEERAFIGMYPANIALMGFVKDVHSVLADCDCCVVTSLREACSLSVMESLSCGVPVISTPVSAAKEVVGENECGVVTSGWDGEELAGKILELLNSKELLSKFSENARRTMTEKYNLSSMIDPHKRLYEKITK